MKLSEPSVEDARDIRPSGDRGPGVLVARARAFNVAEAAHLALTGGEDALAARGAAIGAIVAALLLAATPTGTERLFLMKADRLAHFAVGLDEPLRTHVVELVDAALAADAAARATVGLPPPGRRLSGWIAPAMAVAAAAPVRLASRIRWTPTPEILADFAMRAGLDDPDHVLLAAIATVRGMVAMSSSHGGPAEAGYDDIERNALALCARPATSRAVRDDARRLVVILWLALRRRRPLAAAILRAKLGLDRAHWGAGHAGG